MGVSPFQDQNRGEEDDPNTMALMDDTDNDRDWEDGFLPMPWIDGLINVMVLALLARNGQAGEETNITISKQVTANITINR